MSRSMDETSFHVVSVWGDVVCKEMDFQGYLGSTLSRESAPDLAPEAPGFQLRVELRDS